jgi:hypothetical protein
MEENPNVQLTNSLLAQAGRPGIDPRATFLSLDPWPSGLGYQGLSQ